MTQPDPTNEPRKIDTSKAKKELHGPDVPMGSTAWHAVHALIVAIDASNPPTPAEAREPKHHCKLCGATFTCDNGMWFTNCNCAKDRPLELAKAIAQAKSPYTTPALPESSPGVGAAVAENDKFAQSFDARDWAKAFIERAKVNPSIPTDEGTMIGWFANAIMRGFDEANRRSSPAATEGGRLSDELIVKLWDMQRLVYAYWLHWQSLSLEAREAYSRFARAVEDAARKSERENRGDMLSEAWSIIANAANGDWVKEDPEWVKAAEQWRDKWHGTIDDVLTAPSTKPSHLDVEKYYKDDVAPSTPPADAELRERIALESYRAYHCNEKLEWENPSSRYAPATKTWFLNVADALLPLISSLRAADQLRIDKLEKFKTTVHDALDQMSIPHDDPTNQKSKEGCRVGARLDLVAARIRELEQRVAGKSGGE